MEKFINIEGIRVKKRFSHKANAKTNVDFSQSDPLFRIFLARKIIYI